MNLKGIWAELVQYPGGVLEEIRKVDWPSRQKTVQLTVTVIVVIALATLYVGGLDIVLSRAIQLVLAQ